MQKKLTILLLFFSSSAVAIACNKQQLEPVEAFKQADIVFRGKIENLRYLDDPSTAKAEPRIIVTFKVLEKWKGSVTKTLTIHTTHNMFSCNGFVFNTSAEYLVYSRYNRRSGNFIARLFAPDKPTLGIKVYGGTKLYSKARDDLKFLGKGTPI